MLLLVTFAIVILSSPFKSEAFHFFPFRFDYNQNKTSDHAIKTLTYSSPFTGKTYNLDYQSNYGIWQPPPGPSPFPIAKTWNFDWLFNKGASTTSSQTTASPMPVHSYMPKIFRWDSNWNFNKGTGSMIPSKHFNWDFNWNINKGNGNGNGNGNEERPVTTEKTTTMSTVSDSNTLFHKKIDIKVSYGSASEKPKAEEPSKALNDDEAEDEEVKTRDNVFGTKTSSDDNTDIDPIDSKK